MLGLIYPRYSKRFHGRLEGLLAKEEGLSLPGRAGAAAAGWTSSRSAADTISRQRSEQNAICFWSCLHCLGSWPQILTSCLLGKRHSVIINPLPLSCHHLKFHSLTDCRCSWIMHRKCVFTRVTSHGSHKKSSPIMIDYAAIHISLL